MTILKRILLIIAWVVASWLAAPAAFAQQPQTQTNPNFAVNAGTTNGVAPGYAPTFSATGLTLHLGAGTAFCGGAVVHYAAATLTMTNSTTNYVYLDPASSCVPAVSTTAFTSLVIPLATVVASGGNITSLDDNRQMFSQIQPCEPTTPNGVPQLITTTPSGSAAQPWTCSKPGLGSRNITGTTSTDLIASADCGAPRLDYKGSVAVAVTLPTATTLGVPLCVLRVLNNTTGGSTNVTVTPTTWSIDRGQGAGPVSTLVVTQHSSCTILVDAAGAQWDADCVTTN